MKLIDTTKPVALIMDCVMIWLIADAAQSLIHHNPSMTVIECSSALCANYVARKMKG